MPRSCGVSESHLRTSTHSLFVRGGGDGALSQRAIKMTRVMLFATRELATAPPQMTLQRRCYVLRLNDIRDDPAEKTDSVKW